MIWALLFILAMTAIFTNSAEMLALFLLAVVVVTLNIWAWLIPWFFFMFGLFLLAVFVSWVVRRLYNV
jgi:hypothetical protein